MDKRLDMGSPTGRQSFCFYGLTTGGFCELWFSAALVRFKEDWIGLLAGRGRGGKGRGEFFLYISDTTVQFMLSGEGRAGRGDIYERI